ncbi:MAG: ATP-binding cassette domain-containing protein [Planktomarina sp.]|nr:ATP-binding cassette domain-containing protein [Planktomarina sp.]
MVASAMIKVEDVVVERRGKRLLGPVTFAINDKGITAVVGPNGAGKSTLLRLMHGLERPRYGHLNLPIHMRPQQQAFLFQHPILLRRSVQQNLILPLKLRGVTTEIREQEVVKIATEFGLNKLMEQDAFLLSGGEKQKLTLARALIIKPNLLFLDEPSANLDRPSTLIIENAVKVVADQGCKVILASHSMAQVKRLSEDVLFISDGIVNGPFLVPDFLQNPPTGSAKDWLEDI